MNIEYEIVRSKRKSVAIQIMPDGKVVVKAPTRLTKVQIHSFVIMKQDWIIEKRADALERTALAPHLEFQDGEHLPFLGRELTLAVICRERYTRPRVLLTEDVLTIYTASLEREVLLRAVEHWYREQARRWFTQRVRAYSAYITEPYRQIAIKDTKTRWGSCSSLHNLNFNWRLMLAPEAVAEYVVAHEMCHLRYLNHSREYWQYVESVMPDYKIRKKWLDEHGMQLRLF